MKTQQILLAVATVMLLATSPVWAASSTGCANGQGGGLLRQCSQAPEIDAASGTSAIALLTGILLLMKERTRSRRTSKSDE